MSADASAQQPGADLPRPRPAPDRVLRGAAERGAQRRHLRDPRRVRGARGTSRGPSPPTSARRWRRRSPSRRRTAASSSCCSTATSSAPPRPRRWPRDRRVRAPRGQGQLDLDELREAMRQAIVDGSDGEMRDLARLAIEAFGRRGEGSGVIGVDVQRIRRTLGPPDSGLVPPRPSERRAADAGPRRDEPVSSATCGASWSAT